jgi:Fe-S-cluster-containing hydrogenase component 2/CRP-like cAMP-binding protein
MAVQRNPTAELPPLPGDIELTDEQVMQLSLLAPLAAELKAFLAKNPGAYILRHYRAGSEPVFVQGEPGWTAFYVLTTEEVLQLRRSQLAEETDPAAQFELRKETAVLEVRRRAMGKLEDNHPDRTVAEVQVAVPREARTPQNLLARWLGAVGRPALGQRIVDPGGSSIYVPWDATRTMNYEKLTAPLREGELFGEVSCLYRTPRSATVKITRDCYMLEMLRNILERIQRNKVFKERADEIYRSRVLELEIRKLSLFSELTDDEYAAIRSSVELVTYEPGTIIFDEHERSDSLYIVRIGLVKVMKNVSALLDTGDVVDRNWRAFCQALVDSEAPAAGDLVKAARGGVWRKLSERVRSIARHIASRGEMGRADQKDLLAGINELVLDLKFVDIPEVKAALPILTLPADARAALEQRAELVKKKKDWAPKEARRTNRRLLEALYPAVLVKMSKGGGERILSYASPGDLIGESGLLYDPPQPRNVTCIAHSHPNYYGQVELVRIPAQVFFRIKSTSRAFASKVAVEATEHKRANLLRLLTPVWDDTTSVQLTEPFERLGLIQGQKLMLIDLDRCTRCDECVKACVSTHKDGRTRLFLDGPRFGKYLVPATCRSCLDPVCLIGCPVSSIHRGRYREIIIENWCIGCGLCADNCPYGSIQMHDLGIIPKSARDWHFLPAAATGDGWERAGYRDAHWLIGEAPFRLDRNLRDLMNPRLPKARPAAVLGAICFRHDFELSRGLLRGEAFKLEVTSQADEVKVWVNGTLLEPDEKPRRGRHEFTLPSWTKPTAGTGTPLRAGTNILAIRTTLTKAPTDVLLQAQLAQIRRPNVPAGVEAPMAEEVMEMLVKSRAVVCDMCSSLPGRRPACVQACPHDAAMRVDARSDFPQK